MPAADQTAVSTLDRLAACEAIRQVKARYFRYFDTQDWDAFLSLFVDEAVLDIGGRVSRGVAEIDQRFRGPMTGIQTVHQGTGSEIEVLHSGSATAIHMVEDRIWWPEGAEQRYLHGYGHYHETYTRVGPDWKIASSRLTRLRVDLIPGASPHTER
jgi:ketosteroid isomerase-like protein